MQVAGDNNPSLGELFSALAKETGTLVRKEVQLAKVEITDKAKTFGTAGAVAAAGGGLLLVGALTIYAGIVLVLGTIMPLWASALLVGLVVVLAGGALAYFGWRSVKDVDPLPRETIETLQEDKQWLREQVSR